MFSTLRIFFTLVYGSSSEKHTRWASLLVPGVFRIPELINSCCALILHYKYDLRVLPIDKLLPRGTCDLKERLDGRLFDRSITRFLITSTALTKALSAFSLSIKSCRILKSEAFPFLKSRTCEFISFA